MFSDQLKPILGDKYGDSLIPYKNDESKIYYKITIKVWDQYFNVSLFWCCLVLPRDIRTGYKNRYKFWGKTL